MSGRVDFDYPALIHALDLDRQARGLGWGDLARELHEQSSVLNDRLMDHSLCGGALMRQLTRDTASCQYVLTLLRWLGRAPEEFLVGAVVDVGDTALPVVGTDARLRWDLPATYADLDAQRREGGLTWAGLGRQLGCTPSRLTNLRTARAADMELAMVVTQWLGRPAATYLYAAGW